MEGRQTSLSEDGRSTGRGIFNQRSNSARKEQAPIIINKDEQFMYKAPSTIHETVVATLRKEKDNMAMAL